MNLTKMRAVLFSFLVIVVIVAGSCSDSGKVRKYQEKNSSLSTSEQEAVPSTEMGSTHGETKMPPHSHFQWDTPSGWIEKRESSGFRIASFIIKSSEKESICTIIPLQGEAGGLKANVSRWLGQLRNTTNIDEAIIDSLLASKEKFLTTGQFPGVIVDFNDEVSNASDNSILAAIISVHGNSLFIKMIGEKAILSQNRDKFKSLCLSLRFASLPPKNVK